MRTTPRDAVIAYEMGLQKGYELGKDQGAADAEPEIMRLVMELGILTRKNIELEEEICELKGQTNDD